jgi:hypothetical protein
MIGKHTLRPSSKFAKQTFFNHLKHLKKKGFITREADKRSKLHFKPTILKIAEDIWKIYISNLPVFQAYDDFLKNAEKIKTEDLANFIISTMPIETPTAIRALAEAKDEFRKNIILDLYVRSYLLRLDYLWRRMRKEKDLTPMKKNLESLIKQMLAQTELLRSSKGEGKEEKVKVRKRRRLKSETGRT